MDYSFKKHIHNEYYFYLIFLMSIIPIGIFLIISLSVTIYFFIINKILDLNILLFIFNEFKILPILPIISFISFIILLLRINNTKHFLQNCSEVNAIIEKYLLYYGSRNYSQKEGTETAIKVIFIYKINGIEYKKGYSISKNKNTIEYFEKYKKTGETVKILVANYNSKKIMINEIL